MPTLEQLDDFWSRTRTELASTPLNATATPERIKAAYLFERVTFQSWGGFRVHANLYRPISAVRETRLPGIVTVPGYGGWEFGADPCESQRGYFLLQVFPRHQGLSEPVDDSVEPLVRGLGDRDAYNYRGIYMDAVRGLDYLATRPEVDPNRLALVGTSQGGMIALGAAAIDSRARCVVAHVPAFCDAANNSYLAKHPIRQAANLEMYSWFDPVSLAPLIRMPALVSTGGKDRVCPPETIRAVFDRIPGVKALYHDPELVHTSSSDFYFMTWEWIRRHLG